MSREPRTLYLGRVEAALNQVSGTWYYGMSVVLFYKRGKYVALGIARICAIDEGKVHIYIGWTRARREARK